MFLGLCPPHQCTLFLIGYLTLNISIIQILVTADLDYFLSIRNKKRS